MRLGPVAALACAAGVTVSACSLISTPPTARSLANKIGCTQYRPQQQAMNYFRSVGTCYLNPSTLLTIMTFTSNDIRDQWLQVARDGGSKGVVIMGNLWVVDTAWWGASPVQKAIGGQIEKLS